MSSSTTDVLYRYFLERYAAVRFVAIAVALGALSLIGRGTASPLRELIFSSGLAYLLVLQLRLWDDLADIGWDRIEHPERILARQSSVRAFTILAVALAAVNAVLVALRGGSVSRLMPLGLLWVALGAWYALRDRVGASRLVSSHIILAKYPAIVLLVAPAPATALGAHDVLLRVLTLSFAYVAACAYELLHDDDLRVADGARSLLIVEASLAGVLALIFVDRAILSLGQIQ